MKLSRVDQENIKADIGYYLPWRHGVLLVGQPHFTVIKIVDGTSESPGGEKLIRAAQVTEAIILKLMIGSRL